MSSEETRFEGPDEPGHESSGLHMNPIEKELMEVKQRINANLEEIRRSVGFTQLKYIETVQKDLARGHELLHALIVTECKNKVDVYKRQLERLDKALEGILGESQSSQADNIVQQAPDAIYACIFSPDETLIASVCGDGVVRISELATRRVVHELTGHENDLLFRMDMSPDGTRIMSGGKDKTARIWNPNAGICLMTLTGHTDTVLGTSFVDDNTVATCSKDSTVRIWDIESGKCKFILQPDGSPLLCSTALPSRMLVAVGSSEGKIHFIDARKGKLLHTIEGHRNAIWFMDFSPNGKLLCSCGEDSIVRAWSAETGSLFREFGEDGLCSNYCRFSNNSKMIAASSMDKTVRIWNVENGSMVRTITGHTGWAFSCIFSADDQLLLTSSEDHTVRLWRIDTGQPVTPDMLEKRNSSLLEQHHHEPPTRMTGEKIEDSRSQRMSSSLETLFGEIGTNLCPEHDLPLTFNCIEERKFLCAECKKVHDEQHHVTDGFGLSKMAELAVQNVMANLVQSMHGTDDTLEAHMNLLVESRIAARRKVEMTMDALLDAVYSRRKQLLKQVDAAFDQAVLSLRSQYDAYRRNVVSRMSTFSSEVTSGMLCDAFLNADTRFTKPLSPLALQALQVCYFGNTTSQRIAAEVSKMGNVVINSTPPSGSSCPEQFVSIQKPVAQKGLHDQPQNPRPTPVCSNTTSSTTNPVDNTSTEIGQEEGNGSQCTISSSSSEPLPELKFSSPPLELEKP